MAKVQYYAAASLDGYIARPDGSHRLAPDVTEPTRTSATARCRTARWTSSTRASALSSWARRRIEWVLEHAKEWPYDLPTWVFTSRELPQPPGGEVLLTSEDARVVRDAAMEAAGGKNVWLVGGGNLASSWADEGLIDEVIVTVVPVVHRRGAAFLRPGGRRASSATSTRRRTRTAWSR